MNKIILEKIANKDLPEHLKHIDFDSFGRDSNLYDYQKNALKNLVNGLIAYFSDKEDFYNSYIYSGLKEEQISDLNVQLNDENFNILSEYFPVQDGHISYKNFLNRASFWMATGSGKTLVMVKLIEILYELVSADIIPNNDVLILAPSEKILNQIKKHVDLFNEKGDLYIELKDLKEWEELKNETLNLYDKKHLTVFYYRADNISDEDKIERVSYKTYLNSHKWYMILDEAHKGDSEFSKKQQYYTIMTKNGFSFNFSATFTDNLDITTTVYNFNLKKFIESGYGKHIKVTNQEFKNFNKRRDEEFSLDEKHLEVLKSMIVLTAIKKSKEYIDTIKAGLYHNPLLITIANSVNTPKADLKIFFREVAKIARGEGDIETAKRDLLKDLNKDRSYQFSESEGIKSLFLDLINSIKHEDILKHVFNADRPSTIEVTNIPKNKKELAFKLKSSSKHFGLIVASDAVSWKDNELEGYEINTDVVNESFFDNINSPESTINILMGSRIFAEGWDSNRPNVLNFINLGIDEKSKKFITQAVGRGIRIEPFKNKRQRLSYLYDLTKKHFTTEEFQKVIPYSQHLESLFIFATNKEVVKSIIEHFENQDPNEEWLDIKGIVKNDSISKDVEILIPKFKTSEKYINYKYIIPKDDYDRITNFCSNISDKILLVEYNITVKTLKRIRQSDYFDFQGKSKDIPIRDYLIIIDKHFNKHDKIFSHFKYLEDEIKHYKQVKVKNEHVNENKLSDLIREVNDQLTTIQYTKSELRQLLKDGQISDDEFDTLYENTGERRSSYNVIYEKLEQHYYKPIIIAEDGFENNYQHVINVDSEREFLSAFLQYIKQSNHKLREYDWWYFSKIDETIDEIKIPYYKVKEQEFSNFNPDFVFWLKKDNKYYIKFVDPKTITVPENANDKINGFKQLFNNDKIHDDKTVSVELFYYHNYRPTGLNDGNEHYWTNDLNKIFGL